MSDRSERREENLEWFSAQRWARRPGGRPHDDVLRVVGQRFFIPAYGMVFFLKRNAASEELFTVPQLLDAPGVREHFSGGFR